MVPANSSRGFTLLEVLVAVSIFAIIGLGANQMLRSIIDTQERVKASNDAFNELSRALGMMERDVTQVVSRGVRDEYGEPLPPVSVGTDLYTLELTRAGWNNPARLTRSELQRVAYSLEDEVLYRHFWLVLDRAEDSEPRSQALIRDVRGFRVNVMDGEGETSDAWPDFDSKELLPPALEIIIETELIGEIRRIYAMTELPNVRGTGDPDEAEDAEVDENEIADQESTGDRNAR